MGSQEPSAEARVANDTALRDELRADVGARLRVARHEAGMSQEQVSKELGKGFSLASVYRWEAGVDLPTFDKMTRLATLYGKSLDWLGGRTNCREVFDHGKVIVDREALSEIDQMVQAGKSLEDLRPALLRRPGLNCAWPVPQKPMMLDGEAVATIEHHLDDAYDALRSERSRG